MFTINAIKDEGQTEDGYVLYMSAYIKEFPQICIQIESWKEEELIKEASKMYSFVQDDTHFRRDHPDAPEEIIDFEISWYNDLNKWLKC